MYFLGLDYSTQKLKAIVIDYDGNIIIGENVDYDTDLSHYGTVHGVYKQENGVICAPPAMWIEATDELLKRIAFKIDLSKIAVISGSAQQHTTIFWEQNANYKLAHLNPALSLLEQLKTVFSRCLSPTWMDSSTTIECDIFENFIGSKNKLQSRIGSSLAKRFSGPQIMKAFSDDINLESQTGYITLVSNGMCSVFAGTIVGIDVADAAGTGLQTCGSLDWDSELCSIISDNLIPKLGKITASNCVVGFLNPYFVERYNMSQNCKIVSFTGDNPSSVVGMLLQEHDICISLGTSDTLFTCLNKLPEIVNDIPIFVFPHPLNPIVFVTLLCYKNGSQTRQTVSNQYSGGQWDIFNQLLNFSPPGNNGIFGLFYDLEEIIPPGCNGRYFGNSRMKSGQTLSEKVMDKESIIRSLIEGQLLSKYYHFTKIYPTEVDSLGRLLITGGASINTTILQIAADIFNKPVFSLDTTDSAAMGSVYRAAAGTQSATLFSEFVKRVHIVKRICDPKHHHVYREFFPNFVQFMNSTQTES